MIISIEKAVDNIHHPFRIKKNSPESGHRGNQYQHNKAILGKCSANIIFSGEKLKAFPLRLGKDKDVHSCHYYSTYF